ncbi:MAG: glycerate kinase, partial [Actinomycetota bacterium]|nr:glycerate kinase [Actinomycetota bacterium]
MRVLIAPDGFGGTLSAPEAARAVATGWASVAPADELDLVPLSDGGPGLLDVLATALPDTVTHPVEVEDPLARPVRAAVLLAGGTAYVESALACGLHLLTAQERDVRRTTTYGVGQLVAAALDAGAQRVVVGLGGSATHDGGSGLLAALGVDRLDAAG